MTDDILSLNTKRRTELSSGTSAWMCWWSFSSYPLFQHVPWICNNHVMIRVIWSCSVVWLPLHKHTRHLHQLQRTLAVLQCLRQVENLTSQHWHLLLKHVSVIPLVSLQWSVMKTRQTWSVILTLNNSWMSSHRSWTKFMSLTLGSSKSLVSWEKGTCVKEYC